MCIKSMRFKPTHLCHGNSSTPFFRVQILVLVLITNYIFGIVCFTQTRFVHIFYIIIHISLAAMQRDHRCDHELIGPAACRGKSIVINAPQWTRIIGHLRRGEDDTVLAEQRRQYAEYLRTGSAAMTATWTNSLRAIRERQQNERRAYEESVIRSGEERFEALKAGDEERRQQRIAAAQQLIDRAKEGPRELESAYQHADVLQTREQQCRERAHERGVQQQRRLQAGCETRAAAAQGARELAEMIQVRRRRQDQFKLELAAELAQKRCREQAERAQQMQLERKYRFDEAAAIARKEQMDKEMALAAKQAEKVRRFEEIRAKREKEASEFSVVFFLRI